ncbi:nuclease-related domain-containing protein [Leptothoe sp. PORK10 BA2]|uniref:nuclease-related domain-containing protein n=1 Tax=Leptothoe sp. PORK10 BA2 TaxID=3110254 RepID=UPI002B20023C|nr:nuclease-related domain-containing protein [Leptothoe sp. PORK10 BA2]
MALIIPDAIPSKASQGEQLLFKILSTQLPDNFIVWYEPRVKDLYPDFIILGPDFGLLILEVKGWYASQVARTLRDHFSRYTYLILLQRESSTELCRCRSYWHNLFLCSVQEHI